MPIFPISIESLHGRRAAQLDVRNVVLAGWTGRDRAAMEHHIQELEAIGIKRPATIPVYYRVAAARVTLDTAIQVTGEHTSGEVEFVLAMCDGELLVGVGSDHTDRQAETHGITLSKQLCDKPIAATFWPFAEVRDHWDDLILRATIVTDGQHELYQEGALAKMLPAEQLIRDHDPAQALAATTMLFGGTQGAIGGIRPADRFEGELEDPRLNRRLAFGYDIERLPVRG
jgi:hypothetical protein